MRRFFPLMLVLAMAGPVAPWLRAEDAPNAQELRELRQAIDQQAKQIELLTEQLGRLTRVIEAQKGGETAAKPTETAPATAVPIAAEASKPAADPASDAAKADGSKHVVAKGETLTSIAKHYNIGIAELKNANKIVDERRLQIGQILSIPTAKTPESSDKTEKKENP